MKVILNDSVIDVDKIDIGKLIVADEELCGNLLHVYKLYFNKRYYYLSVTIYKLLESLSCSYNQNINYEIVVPENVIDLNYDIYKKMIEKY